MARRRVRYYFGRFNLMAQYERKEIFVAEGLRTPTVVRKRGQNWQFLKVESAVSELGELLTGYLAKYRPVTEEEVAVPAAQDLGDQVIENLVIAKARFFLHLESGLIAYHPVGSHITRDQFRRNFAEIFEASKADFL